VSQEIEKRAYLQGRMAGPEDRNPYKRDRYRMRWNQGRSASDRRSLAIVKPKGAAK
jgi:hypothetical protein